MPEQDWKPIESAPKDGHGVLVVEEWAGYRQVVPAYWSQGHAHLAACWLRCGDGWSGGEVRRPVLWMPFPDPPLTDGSPTPRRDETP